MSPESNNRVGIKFLPKIILHENHPGHMGVYWNTSNKTEYRGYRFYVDDLPEEYQDASKWRDYLFDNMVPGYIFDDDIIRDQAEDNAQFLIDVNWPFKTSVKDIAKDTELLQ